MYKRDTSYDKVASGSGFRSLLKSPSATSDTYKTLNEIGLRGGKNDGRL